MRPRTTRVYERGGYRCAMVTNTGVRSWYTLKVALCKKYPSFQSDYHAFLKELEINPFAGESLGRHTYKHRMAITSKGKGKSGGARVLTYNIQRLNENEVFVTLMTIYDKGEISNVTDTFIRSLVQQIEVQ